MVFHNHRSLAMDIQKGPYQPWFGFLFTFIFLVGALTLGFDIATDYQGSFGTSESSWYYLTWELAEIAVFSTLAGWFMYRTSNNSAVLGWSIFAAVGLVSAHGLFYPELVATGLPFKRGVQLGIAALLIPSALDWKAVSRHENSRKKKRDKGRSVSRHDPAPKETGGF